MIMSVSTLIIFSGAATPSRVVNLSIGVSLSLKLEPEFVFSWRLHGGGSSPRPPPFRRAGGPDIVGGTAMTPALQALRENAMAMVADAVDTVSVIKLHPVIGAEIRGVDLSRPLDAATLRQIKDA